MAHVSNHTRLVIFEDIVRHFAQHYPATHGMIIPAPTTSPGSSTTLKDTKLGRGSKDPNFYDGCLIYIISGSAAGDIATVDDAGFDGTSQLTFSPAASATIGSGDTYALLPPGLSPETVHAEINRVLRDTYGPHLWIPSLVNDGDFENDVIATDWPDVSTPSVTDFIITPANVLFGDRAIQVTADGADEGVESLSIPVTDVESVLLSTWVKVVTGSMDVVLRNQTAGADMSTLVTVDEEAWTEVRFIESIEAAQQLLRVRFQSNANLDDFFISAFVTVQAQSPRPYNMPPWFVSESQYMGVLTIPPGAGSEATNALIALSGEMKNANIKPYFIHSASAVHPFMVQLPGADGNPIALVLKRAFSELSSDTATTHARRDYVVKKAIGNLHWITPYLPNEPNWRSEAAGLADALSYGRGLPVLEEGPSVPVR